jgi:hypothetical protein
VIRILGMMEIKRFLQRIETTQRILFFSGYYVFPADDKTATDKILENISGGSIIRGDFFQKNSKI